MHEALLKLGDSFKNKNSTGVIALFFKRFCLSAILFAQDSTKKYASGHRKKQFFLHFFLLAKIQEIVHKFRPQTLNYR